MPVKMFENRIHEVGGSNTLELEDWLLPVIWGKGDSKIYFKRKVSKTAFLAWPSHRNGIPKSKGEKSPDLWVPGLGRGYIAGGNPFAVQHNPVDPRHWGEQAKPP